MEPVEIYRSAWQMLTLYGGEASGEAARRADEMERAGDHDGCAHWRRIGTAIEELIAESRDGRTRD
jgi:hypothetical protein